MKTRTRNILIAVGIVLMIFAGLLGFGIYSLYSFFNRINESAKVEIPAELQEAKVFKGAEFLTKNEFFKLTPLDYTEQIKKAWKISDEQERQNFISSETAKTIYGFDDIKICGDEIVAVGKFGGYAFGSNDELKREIFFEPSEQTIKIGWYEQQENKTDLDNLKIIELDKQGKCGFLSFGYRQGVTVYDAQGKKIWNYGGEKVADLGKMLSEKSEDFDKKIYVTEAAAVDLDGDNRAEYVVSRKNDGIRAFDQNGNEKWFQPDEYPTAKFRLVDFDGDGAKELIAFQGMSSAIRDKMNGNVLKKIEIDGWQKNFLEIEDGKRGFRLFEIDGNKLSISDLNNKVLLSADAPLSEIKVKPKKYDFPAATPYDLGDGTRAEPMETSFSSDSESIYQPKALWVKLQKDKPEYLAVIGSFISIPRSNFYVYDEKGNLVYHELLPEKAETIQVKPSANSSEEILIGGKNTIWKFAVNDSSRH